MQAREMHLTVRIDYQVPAFFRSFLSERVGALGECRSLSECWAGNSNQFCSKKFQ